MSEKPEFDPYPDERGSRYGWCLGSGGLLLLALVLLARFLPWEGYGPMFSLPIAIVVLAPLVGGFLVTILVHFSYRRDAVRHAETGKSLPLDWQASKPKVLGSVKPTDPTQSAQPNPWEAP